MAEEVKGKISVAALKRLFSLTKPFARPLSVAGLMMLLDTVLTLSLPLVARLATNTVIQSHSAASLNRYGLLMLLMMLSSGLFLYIEYYLVAFAGNRIVTDLRARLFAHLERLPVFYFDSHRSGDLTSYLSNDVAQMQQTLTEDAVRIVGNVVTLIGGIIMALVIDWQLTVVVLIMLTVFMSYFILLGPRLRKLSRKGLDALAEVTGTMTEALGNVRLVKAFDREEHEEKRVRDGLNNVLSINMRAARIESSFGAVGLAGFGMVLIGVVWYGGLLVLSGALSPGSMLAFLLTVAIISGPMGSIAIQISRLQRAIGASERLFAILNEPMEQIDQAEPEAIPNSPAHVIFEDIDFSYNAENPVLHHFNLEMLPGKVTALVGPSGAGKSTVSSLLFRFYEPQSGHIFLNGIELNRLSRSDLRRYVGLVPQEPTLYNASIRENIRYGKLDATNAEVEAAGRAANVEEFAFQLTDGYDTLIGERGVTLSGGQRQRVAIARAVLKDPRLLLLDEATSALDTRSESLVHEALERLMRGRTTLVIAHRLSTVQDADCIAVLQNGCIVEQGRHVELIELGGIYADLYSHRFDREAVEV